MVQHSWRSSLKTKLLRFCISITSCHAPHSKRRLTARNEANMYTVTYQALPFYAGRQLPRTQARSSGLKSDWSDFGSALGIMGKAILCVNAKRSHGQPLHDTIARSRVFRVQSRETPRNEAGLVGNGTRAPSVNCALFFIQIQLLPSLPLLESFRF